MIGYVCIGTNDLPKAARFYDGLMPTLGAKRLWETERCIAWGTAPEAPMLLLIKPYDGKPATAGNGTMVALSVQDKPAVDAAYKKALALGAKDEGPAGARGDDFYAGYFRDPEGNKLAVFAAG
jgi:catechol 2,3-dioxygenase-like lactoylglutathione lyase family enzyme